jgi:hypothetical protein
MSELSMPQLEYIVDHVFLPPKLPGKAEPEDLAAESDGRLCQLVLDAALGFSGQRGGTGFTPFPDNSRQWGVVTKLLRKLVDFPLTPSAAEIQRSLLALSSGGVSNGPRIQVRFVASDPVAGRFFRSACARTKCRYYH